MKNLLIVDIKTNDLSMYGNVIDAGWCIYDIEQRVVKASGSTYFKTEENNMYPVNAVDVKHTNGCLRDFKRFMEFPINNYKYDAVVCYQSSFFKRYADKSKVRLKKPIICAREDIEWETKESTFNEQMIKSGVYNLYGNRSIHVCLALSDAFSRIENLLGVIKSAKEKYKIVYADISEDDIELAIESGFKYDKEKKLWFKKILDKDEAKFKFKVVKHKNET